MSGRGFDAMHDAGLVRAAIAELGVVHAFLSAAGDVAAEMPGVELGCAAGMRAGAGVVAARIRRGEARLARLTAVEQVRSGVVVVDPDRRFWVQGSGGLAVLPVVSAPRVGGVRGVCSGVSRLAAGGCSRARVHPDADVIMVVLFGTAVLAWWDAEGVTAGVELVPGFEWDFAAGAGVAG